MGEKYPLRICTSHLDIKKLAHLSERIRIQGTSRFANHKYYQLAHCPVIKERMWHPRLVYSDRFVGTGSWDFAQIKD